MTWGQDTMFVLVKIVRLYIVGSQKCTLDYCPLDGSNNFSV